MNSRNGLERTQKFRARVEKWVKVRRGESEMLYIDEGEERERRHVAGNGGNVAD